MALAAVVYFTVRFNSGQLGYEYSLATAVDWPAKLTTTIALKSSATEQVSLVMHPKR